MSAQNDLLEEFARLGRPKTPRGLTDWRSKGFLPRLVQRGAGQGRGARYAWREPDILERALMVEDLLANGARGDQVLLCLWYAGFEIDLSKARSIWLSQLEEGSTPALGKQYHELDDLLGSMARRFAKHVDPSLGLTVNQITDVMVTILGLLYNESEAFDVFDNLAFVDYADIVMANSSFGKRHQLPSVSRASVQRIFDAVSDIAAFSTRIETLRCATDDELRVAYRRWCIARRIGSRLIEKYLFKDSNTDAKHVVWRLSTQIAPWFIPCLSG